MSRQFDVDRALAAWARNYPDRGERIAALRRELYDCERERQVMNDGSQKVPLSYPETARNIRLMLAAEGSEV